MEDTPLEFADLQITDESTDQYGWRIVGAATGAHR
ncbi:hypothetical protein SAMN05216215_108617 [Saccharopolyspora shandongensis]|uniref:Uncharacterized protein n=1 Tax=Saccharopolyspora shandongensis TaxID=418495 RepID=A0A1H3TKH7_9PSEU|nr:hypothetical protein SAMN05216215_108617 [Saccharopolyspora shandongensis]